MPQNSLLLEQEDEYDDTFDPNDPIYRVNLWINRYRGDRLNRSRHIFAIYAESNGKLHWWCEVPQHVTCPKQLFDRIVAAEARTAISLKAAGSMDVKAIDFTLYPASKPDIRRCIICTFAANQDHDFDLRRYEDARILFSSVDSGWGTVGELLNRYGFSIPR